MKIQFNDVRSQYLTIRENLKNKIEECLSSGSYIDGPYVREFEEKFSVWSGSKYSIAVSNGTDGLKLAIQVLRKSGKNLILIPANTFIADALAVSHQIQENDTSFDIELIDCDDFYQIDTNKLEISLNINSDCYDNIIVIAVHLYGHPCDMEKILRLKDKFAFKLIEDASQAHGAEINDVKVGNFSDICVYSLYPGKNLGAVGDAGIITTNNDKYNQLLCSLRNYGSEKKYHYNQIGWNNRMDGIQALVLSEKINHLDHWNNKRFQLAELYDANLSNIDQVITPKNAPYCTKNVYHIYCIRVINRENLQKFLNDFEIPTIIHYPVPIQNTTIYNFLNKNENHNTTSWCNNILSLPMHPYMLESEVEYISEKIRLFYQNTNN